MEIRRASEKDIPFIAKCILSAASVASFEELNQEKHKQKVELMEELCRSDWSLYYYEKSLIAYDGDLPVGAILSYDGGTYESARTLTFERAHSIMGDTSNTEMETREGEYYLDSMTIIPEYRGQGIGIKLMKEAMKEGRRQGFKKFSLLVDSQATRLKEYYMKLGFEEERPVAFLGHTYTRMILQEY